MGVNEGALAATRYNGDRDEIAQAAPKSVTAASRAPAETRAREAENRSEAP